MQTLTRTNAAQSRARRLSQRFNNPAQDARDHADVQERLYQFNVTRFGHTPRVNRLQERAMNARCAADALSSSVAAQYGDAEALAIETLEIAEAGREIAYSADVARYEFEISCLRVRLLTARGVEALDVADSLGAAREDLVQVKCELGE